MGKIVNVRSDQQGCQAVRTCVQPILKKCLRAKDATKRKKVRFNLQGMTPSWFKSCGKKSAEQIFAGRSDNVKGCFKSQSCTEFDTLSRKLLKGNNPPRSYLSSSPKLPLPLPFKNSNSNSGSNNSLASIFHDRAQKAPSDYTDFEDKRLDHGNCRVKASVSEGNNFVEMDETKLSLEISDIHGQKETGSLSEIGGNGIVIDRLSPSSHSLVCLIRDLSNVTMENQTWKESARNVAGQTNLNCICQVPPNSPNLGLPMDEDHDLYSRTLETNVGAGKDRQNLDLNNNATNDDDNQHGYGFEENATSMELPMKGNGCDLLSINCGVGDGTHGSHEIEPAFSICPVLNCGMYFDTRAKFENHINQINHNPCNPKATLLNGHLPQNKQFLCPECGLKFQEREECHKHMQDAKHLSEMSPLPYSVYACPQCLSFFSSTDEAQEHSHNLAHFNAALAFRGDLQQCKETVPIPVPDRVVEILSTLCLQSPHSLSCLESSDVVTSVKHLKSLISQGHLVFAQSSKTVAEVFSSLLTDQACGHCHQVIFGFGPSNLAVHVSCPMKGPVLAREPKSLESFIRHCGITDTVILDEHGYYEWTTSSYSAISAALDPNRKNSISPGDNVFIEKLDVTCTEGNSLPGDIKRGGGEFVTSNNTAWNDITHDNPDFPNDIQEDISPIPSVSMISRSRSLELKENLGRTSPMPDEGCNVASIQEVYESDSALALLSLSPCQHPFNEPHVHTMNRDVGTDHTNFRLNSDSSSSTKAQHAHSKAFSSYINNENIPQVRRFSQSFLDLSHNRQYQWFEVRQWEHCVGKGFNRKKEELWTNFRRVKRNRKRKRLSCFASSLSEGAPTILMTNDDDDVNDDDYDDDGDDERRMYQKDGHKFLKLTPRLVSMPRKHLLNRRRPKRKRNKAFTNTEFIKMTGLLPLTSNGIVGCNNCYFPTTSMIVQDIITGDTRKRRGKLPSVKDQRAMGAGQDFTAGNGVRIPGSSADKRQSLLPNSNNVKRCEGTNSVTKYTSSVRSPMRCPVSAEWAGNYNPTTDGDQNIQHPKTLRKDYSTNQTDTFQRHLVANVSTQCSLFHLPAPNLC